MREKFRLVGRALMARLVVYHVDASKSMKYFHHQILLFQWTIAAFANMHK